MKEIVKELDKKSKRIATRDHHKEKYPDLIEKLKIFNTIYSSKLCALTLLKNNHPRKSTKWIKSGVKSFKIQQSEKSTVFF